VPSDAGSSAGGKTSKCKQLLLGSILNISDWDLEIRKRYVQPLAVETGEFPDAETIQNRMVPICYEEGLAHGCSPACAPFMVSATEHFIKEMLSIMYNRSRTNIPSGSVNSVMTHRFKKQLEQEEDSLSRGELVKVAGTGLLPVEAKEAATRLPLAMHDLKLATRIGDAGLGQFPTALAKVANSYEEGEYEALQEQARLDALSMKYGGDDDPRHHDKALAIDADGDVKMNGMTNGVNGTHTYMADDDTEDDWGWEGGSASHRDLLNNALEECLSIGI
jgi:transcriptional coactivator HFI1/ADA1